MADIGDRDGAAIEVPGLTKAYGDVQAVRGIDLTVEHGKVVALLGPNGAGQTTTVEILEGYRSRDGGTVRSSATTPPGSGSSSTAASGSSCSPAAWTGT